MVEKIRVSIGSAAVLGLVSHKIDYKARPTTCYLMQYHSEGCSGNCAFCSQTSAHDKLSRVVWPEFDFSGFLTSIETKKVFGRYCVQCLIYDGYERDLETIVHEIRKRSLAPISAAIGPLEDETLIRLKSVGLTEVGLSLDAATSQLFQKVKGSNDSVDNWNLVISSMKSAQKIFGNGSVRCHIIVGLGETEKDVCLILEELFKDKITSSIFPFMPIKGTKMEKHPRPTLESYRKLQIFRYLLYNGIITSEFVDFDEKGLIICFKTISKNEINEIIMKKKRIFQTNGCSACNRPYYTSRPGEVQYDYPFQPEDEDLKNIYSLLEKYFQ